MNRLCLGHIPSHVLRLVCYEGLLAGMKIMKALPDVSER